MLYISEACRLQLKYAAEAMPNDEITGFGRIEKVADGYRMTDIVIPPQEVGGAHVEIDFDLVQEFYSQVAGLGQDPLEWRVWWHKHPGNGKPSPSNTDKETLERFAKAQEDTGLGFGWMLGVIISQDASAIYGWLTVATGPWPLTQPDVDIKYEVMEDSRLRARVMEQVKEVKKRTYTSPSSSSSSTSSGYKKGTKQHYDTKQRRWIDDEPAPAPGEQPRHGKAVVDIRKSEQFPGHVEIELEGGVIHVAKDTGQAEQWAERKQAPRTKTYNFGNHCCGPDCDKVRPDKKVKTRMQEYRTAAKKARGEGRELTSRKVIGFDWEGVPVVVGQEWALHYDLKGRNVPDSFRLAAMERDVAEGKNGQLPLAPVEKNEVPEENFIGWDAWHEPLVKGEEEDLFYDIEGRQILEGQAAIDELRRQFNIPEQLGDGLVAEYVAMVREMDELEMQAGMPS